MNDYERIADLYDAYVNDTRDYAFWRRWAAEATGSILELTAGTGRVTAALAQASGQPILAVDLSPAMLRRLVCRVEAPRRVWAVAGDLRAVPARSEHFGLVIIPFNSLGELVEAADRAKALAEVRRVLAPGGRAVVTLHDPARRREALDGEARRLGPFEVAGRRLEVIVRGRIIGADLAESEQTYRLTDAAGVLAEQRQVTLRFALPGADSLVSMAADSGLEVERLFGDYYESPYAAGRSQFVIGVFGRATTQLNLE